MATRIETSPKRSELLGVISEWQVPLERAEAAVNHDGNTLAGYAAVVNVWSEFDSFEGPFRARLSPTAFDKTLKEHGTDFKVLFDHGRDSFGGLPIGKPTKVEMREKGLWTETQLSQARSVQEEIKPRLEEGSLQGMSITFEVLAEEWSMGTGPNEMDERTIKEVRLHEFGPVVWPQFPEAAIAGVFGKDNRREAVSPDGEGRSTSEEAAAPDDEGRDTSADDERMKRLEALDRESARHAEEIQWLQRTN
jgi:HK97 family phage prohead protease